jgi:hypothetical protein
MQIIKPQGGKIRINLFASRAREASRSLSLSPPQNVRALLFSLHSSNKKLKIQIEAEFVEFAGMDPDVALGLVKHGATLLLLDVPQYNVVGLDTQVKSSSLLGS